MKTKIMFYSIFLWLSAFMGIVLGGTEGTTHTFYGTGAGASTTFDIYYGTFIGAYAGNDNTTGIYNTFIGHAAGGFNTEGSYNTFVGRLAGSNNTTGNENTFLGYSAGAYSYGNQNTFIGKESGGSNGSGYDNTFLGYHSGTSNNTGFNNTYLGAGSGNSNTTGYQNTFLGYGAGSNNTGSGNVFLGFLAGSNATGSDKLYIDNSDTSTPLIYGEFNNNKLTINGNLEVIGPDNGLIRLSNVTTNNTTKASRMVLRHYDNTQSPVYLFGAASTASDNFVALGGGNPVSVPAVAATQIDLFTAPTPTTQSGTPRITIKNNGYVGIGTQIPSYPLEMAGGAYSNGASWIDGSSRGYKEEIEALTIQEALEAIKDLNPVKYAYKSNRTEKRVGFIAEDVPELVATKDRKGLSSMDIVAVLTKVVQEQQSAMREQQKIVQELKAENEGLKKDISSLVQRFTALEGKGK